MLKKTIIYHDLDGNEKRGDFYFNLTKAELANMLVGGDGDLIARLQEVVRSRDGVKMFAAFKDILKASYGVRSEDGQRFIKSDELWEQFTQTDAYSELFAELAMDGEACVQFVTAVLPKDLVAKTDLSSVSMPSLEDVAAKARTLEAVDGRPLWQRENRQPTDEELAEMSPEELVALLEASEQPEPEIPAWIREGRDPTKAEMAKMTKAELVEATRIKLERKRQSSPRIR